MKEQSPAPVKVTAPCGCWSPTPLHINGALAVLAGRCLQGGEGLPPPSSAAAFRPPLPPHARVPLLAARFIKKNNRVSMVMVRQLKNGS